MDAAAVPPFVKTAAPDYVIRIGGAIGLVPLLRERDVELAPLAMAAGIPLHAFDDPDHVVPFPSLARLLELVCERTGSADIGLRACERTSLGGLGLVGRLVGAAPTVAEALARIQAFLHLHDQGAVPFLVREGNTAVLGYELLAKGVRGTDQIVHGALAIGANVLRDLCGRGFALREVEFAYTRPAEWIRFRLFFGAPVRFERTRNALHFDAAWLDRGVATADPATHDALLIQARRRATIVDSTMPDRIRRTIRTLLMAGRYSESEVAATFGVSLRTFTRRLQQNGGSFRQLLDQARFDAACLLLANTRASGDAISAQLGYADSTAFIRAFRRWSGTTPQQWRRAAQQAMTRLPVTTDSEPA